jgi:amidase
LATGEQSSTAVDRLIAAGVVILGITNVPENLPASETDNILYGRTVNPYNKDLTAGGSSGGEAALIACGGSVVGLGSDAAGSIRLPASFCGITGLKPTKGLVPLTGLIPADGGGLKADISMYGPMARHAEDLALILQVIQGPDHKDPACAPVALPCFKSVDASKLTVKYFINAGLTPTCPGVHRAIQAAVDQLSTQLNPIEAVEPPECLKDTYKLLYETCFLEGNNAERYEAGLKHIKQTEISSLYKQFMERAHHCGFSNAELHNRMHEIYLYKRSMFDLIGDADILLMPTTPTPAREHGTTHDALNDFEYTMISNLTGWPAASVYCGDDKYGMPIGLQIMAKPWEDHKVLAYAKAAQALLGIPEIITPTFI